MRLSARRLASSVACLGLAAFLVGAVFAQGDPQVGVWKLNVEKSKFDPGPALKSATTTIVAVGVGTKVVVNQVTADGSTRHWEFTANYDGKDTPMTGNPDADTVARTILSVNTVQTVSKKAGKVVSTQTSVVSSDGKIRTVTTKGVNASGQPVNNVAVYESSSVSAAACRPPGTSPTFRDGSF